jgi:hypothetical protein
MKVKQGSVVYPADKIIQTQWGERQTVKIKLADGTQETIWFNVGKTPHVNLAKGDTVQILYEESNGKTVKRLVVNEDNLYSDIGSKEAVKFIMPNNHPKVNLTEEEKQLIKDYIKIQTQIYTHCVEIVKYKITEKQLLTSNEDIRAIATSIYIATQRKFNL